MKKKLFGAAAVALAAIAGTFSLAACGGKEPTAPEHVAAVAADCTTDGNIEYWTKGGKFYSDAACKTEIDEAQTVIDALGHDFENGELKKDYISHWRECARVGCGESETAVSHIYTDGVCSCGFEGFIEHHEAKSANCTDGGCVEHWTKGGKYFSDADCTVEIAYEDAITEALGHTPAAWQNDADGHWRLCDVCGETVTETEEHVSAWGGDAMQHWHECDDCGFILDEKENHAATWHATDETKHWHECNTCGKITDEKADHSFAWVTDTPATQSATGLKHEQCACGARRSENTVIPVLPEGAVHHPRVEKTCTTDGNIEYWTKGGKFYSDAACETEITEAETVLPKGHTPKTEWSADASQHWHDCDDCGQPADEKTNHDFNSGDKGGKCECGRTNGFENFEVFAENSDLGVTREDTASSVKVKATHPDNEAWHIKLEMIFDDVLRGHYYEITFKFTSNVAGTVKLEAYGGAVYEAEKTVANGSNTITFRFANGAADGNKQIALQLGMLSAFELEFTEVTVRELTADLSAYTLGRDDPMQATMTHSDDGKQFTITASGSSTDWHLKVNQRLPLSAGKRYEITYVFTSDREENTCFEASDTTIDNDWNWARAGVNIITIRFTANVDDQDHYTCFKLGQLAKDGEVNLTFTYIEFREIA